MSKVIQSMRIAFRALRVNKLRSVLTMLGIIIGVGAVIAMVSIGSGAADRIKQQIASIGSNVIIIQGGSQNQGGVRNGNGNQQTLTRDDAEAIAELTSVAHASPQQENMQQVIFQNTNWRTQIQGVYPEYLDIRDIKLEDGEMFTMDHVRSAAKVCILGKTVVDNLFPDQYPIGQQIRIRKIPFTVIGVTKPKGQSANGQDQDDYIIMPITTAQKKVSGSNRANASNQVGRIMVQAREGRTQSALVEIEALLRQTHKLQPNEDNDFSARSLEEVAAAAQESANTTGLLLAAIASVSLVVGGIGIMNIMLVSVTERTKEIGLRQAVGAKTNDILGQFLVEAVTLSLLGGALGVTIGIGVSVLISKFFAWNTLVSIPSIVAAVAFSGLVGIFFGYYPARKAALLDPIEALRYE